MIALRLVIDTNVLVSAALDRESLHHTVLDIAITKPARFYVSTPILEEYADVLSRPKFKLRKGERLQLLQLIRNRCVVVTPRWRLSVASDPDDNIFVECADAARADYLITGNLRHYPRFWKGTKIIAPRDFIEAVTPHLF